MGDLAFLGMTGLFTLATLGLVFICHRLMGP